MEKQQPEKPTDDGPKVNTTLGSPTGDVVAAAVAPEEFINLRVMSQDGSEVFFKLKKTTPFSKLMQSYCERQGLNPSNCRFLFDGARLRGEQTAKELQMEENDIIDCCLTQIGG